MPLNHEQARALIIEREAEKAAERYAPIKRALADAYEDGYGDGQNDPNGYGSKEDRDKCVERLFSGITTEKPGTDHD